MGGLEIRGIEADSDGHIMTDKEALMQKKIREKYSLIDERRIIRSKERDKKAFKEYDDYAEKCIKEVNDMIFERSNPGRFEWIKHKVWG
ncbi:MAG: hypothetical protein LBS61_04900 [Endomicrobium sp.]|jgi:hypothetical protein|nr:hypothetical protein [Endomicrobium sp.]